MKIFICTGCGRMTAASRKKELACLKCNELPMEKVKLTFEQFSEMDEQKRADYVKSWLYIHKVKADSHD